MTAITGHLVATTQGRRFDARFRYNPADPFAVTLEFAGQPSWRFARDLLISGMVLPAGEGDVLVRPVKEGVEITLRSPSGELEIVFDHNALFDLLHKTLAIVPPGSEVVDFDAEAAHLGIAS
jgi:hypothetical protein